MKLLVFFSFGLILLNSCSSNEKPVVVRKVSHKSTFDAPKVEVNRLLTMEIEGMMCVMGCGASIRKELRTTNAVGNVEFDFEKDRKTNIAKISFNKDKISADKIISIVSSMNDKQFKVGKTSTEDIESTEMVNECKDHCEKKCDTEEKSTMDLSSTSAIEVPNLLNILTQFFVN